MTDKEIIIDHNAMEPGTIPRWRYSQNRSKRILKKIKKRLRAQYGSEYYMRPVAYILPGGQLVMHPGLVSSMNSVRDREGYDIARAILQTRPAGFR